MIGGYIYNQIDMDIEHRLEKRIKGLFHKIMALDSGFLFFDDPFEGIQTPCLVSDEHDPYSRFGRPTHLLRGCIHNRVPHRLRSYHEPLAGQSGALPATC